MPQRGPLLANLMGRAASIPQGTPVQVGVVQIATLSQGAEGTTLTLSAASAGGASRVCHQVAAGETLWRIASQLQAQVGSGSDTYSYLLALVQENRPGKGKGIRVQTGQRLYCPKAETLAQFDAMSPAQRQQQFARLEQGR